MLDAMPELPNGAILALADGCQLSNTLHQQLVAQLGLVALCRQLLVLLCYCAEACVGA